MRAALAIVAPAAGCGQECEHHEPGDPTIGFAPAFWSEVPTDAVVWTLADPTGGTLWDGDDVVTYGVVPQDVGYVLVPDAPFAPHTEVKWSDGTFFEVGAGPSAALEPGATATITATPARPGWRACEQPGEIGVYVSLADDVSRWEVRVDGVDVPGIGVLAPGTTLWVGSQDDDAWGGIVFAAGDVVSVQVRAVDWRGDVHEWSEPLDVEIPGNEPKTWTVSAP